MPVSRRTNETTTVQKNILDTGSQVEKSQVEQKLADLLESVEGGEKWGRYSFLGYDPIMRVTCQEKKIIIKEGQKQKEVETTDSLSVVRDILKQLCAYKGVEIIEGHLMPDHVHMLVSIPPKMSVSSFMGYLKGKSALMIFDKHANLKYKFGNRHFWAEGYYVSTVGLNEATIKKYIQEQESHDIAMDKLSVKEYEDPFKG